MSLIWCWDDPIVALNGTKVSIDIGVRGEPDVVRRHVQLAETTILVPEGVTTETLAVTNEFFAETVRFVTIPGATDATIEIRFRATKDLPIAVRVDGWLVGEGSTFGVLTATLPLPAAVPERRRAALGLAAR